MIQISYRALILLAFLILVLPLKWLLCALLAALIHEGAHMSVLTLCGGRVESITIDAGGTVIDSFAPDRKAEILSILAGPVSSLMLLFGYRWIPELSLCGMVQGLFNLLPIFPLDGGRLLNLLLSDTTAVKVLHIQKVMFLFISLICLIFVFLSLFR